MADKPSLKFEDEPVRQIVSDWWTGLEEDRGGWAELRRCRSIEEVFNCQAYFDLYRALQKLAEVGRVQLEAAAGLVAHVRSDATEARSLAWCMAESRPDSGRAKVSDLRFRRLLKIENRQELYPSLIRILRLLKYRAPVVSLANDVYYWGSAVRRRWAYDYYTNAPEMG